MARDTILSLLIFTVIYLFQYSVVALPRDTSVIETDFALNNDVAMSKVKEISPSIILESDTLNESKIPGRLSCSHEEATEDPSCLEHCLPKGYSYGLCVSHTCSCI